MNTAASGADLKRLFRASILASLARGPANPPLARRSGRPRRDPLPAASSRLEQVDLPVDDEPELVAGLLAAGVYVRVAEPELESLDRRDVVRDVDVELVGGVDAGPGRGFLAVPAVGERGHREEPRRVEAALVLAEVVLRRDAERLLVRAVEVGLDEREPARPRPVGRADVGPVVGHVERGAEDPAGVVREARADARVPGLKVAEELVTDAALVGELHAELALRVPA